MSDPLVLSQLRAKQAEIERQLDGLNAKMAEVRADLVHVVATIRMFDPKASDDRPAAAYQEATKTMDRQELFTLCKAALSVAAGPLCTRELARYVVKVQGWDTDDRRLYLTVSQRIGATLTRFERRGMVKSGGYKDKAVLWRMP